MQFKRAALTAAFTIGGGLSPMAFATNGYFMHGYGAKASGQAGVSIAQPQDALAAANNPAGTVWVGDRLDVEATFFRPIRGSEFHGNQLDGVVHKADPYAGSVNHLLHSAGFNDIAFDPNANVNGKYGANESKWFLIPDMGITKQLGDPWGYGDIGVGLAIYGNGGMNTDYKRGRNPFNGFFSPGSSGVEFQQLFVTPSIAWKINDRHSVGLKMNYVWQRFRAKGLGIFGVSALNYGVFSAHPQELQERKWATGDGIGWGLGYQGEILDGLTLGLTWQSKIHTDKFDHYRGLFADGGNFDVPESYGAGLSWKATPAWTLGLDVQKINFGDVTSVGADFKGLQQFVQGQRLGTRYGPGFGWNNITVYKLGTSYQITPQWTVRGGVSHTRGPIDKDQTFFNTLAPATIKTHASLGATWAPGLHHEFNAAYTHAFEEKVHGNRSIPGLLGGGEVDNYMHQDIFELGYAYKF